MRHLGKPVNKPASRTPDIKKRQPVLVGKIQRSPNPSHENVRARVVIKKWKRSERWEMEDDFRMGDAHFRDPAYWPPSDWDPIVLASEYGG
jgi:hypothetical protein